MSQNTSLNTPLVEKPAKARRKWLKRLSWTFAILAGKWVIFALVIWFLAPRAPEPDRMFDAIIVLGSGCNEDGTPGETLEARVDKGVELYKAGRAPILILTGGGVRYPFPESDCAKRHALELGVPASAILTEGKSRNTMGNAREAQAISDAKNVLIVTSGYHGFRAAYLFSQYFPHVAFERCSHRPMAFTMGFLREPMGVLALLWRKLEPPIAKPAK
jgi:uncharacterized SAM-binding protein YcdF (DUF218 family)